MVLKNYLNKIKYGCLVGLAALSFYASPSMAQAQEIKKSELEKIVALGSLENSDKDSTQISDIEGIPFVSVLTNFDTYKLEWGLTLGKKILHFGMDMSGMIKNKKKNLLIGLITSKRINLEDKKILIMPYFTLEGSLSHSKDPITGLETGYGNFGNVSFGLRIGREILKKPDESPGLGVDVRYINYFDKKWGKDLVVGIIAYNLIQ